MSYSDDEAKRAARARLQARMERRGGSAYDAADEADGRARGARRESSRSPRNRPADSAESRGQGQAQSRRPRPDQGVTRPRQEAPRSVRAQSRKAADRQLVRQGQPRSQSGRKPASGQGSVQLPFSLPFELPFPITPVTLGAAAVILVLLIVLVFNLAHCGGGSQEGSSATSGQAEATPSAVAAVPGEGSSASSGSGGGDGQQEVDADQVQKLVDLIGQDEADKLLATAKTDPDALWIASHVDEYAIDGIEVQVKILKLAADEPQAVAFVRSFPSEYPANAAAASESLAMSADSPSSDIPGTAVPHFYQWDRRWGNTVYSSAAFGLTGCGPTSYAMVYQGVTGNTDLNPYDMAQLAQERGYMSQYNGTANDFFGAMAGELGMTYEELYPSAESLTDSLKSGKVVIALLGPGLFTTSGHFFVLAGLTDDGKVILNDPYSYERSSQTWDAETIAQESMIFFAFSKA